MICKKCKEEIKYLDVAFVKHHSGILEIDPDGSERYEEESAIQDWEEEEYSCPDCGEILFTNDSEAIDFLKGVK